MCVFLFSFMRNTMHAKIQAGNEIRHHVLGHENKISNKKCCVQHLDCLPLFCVYDALSPNFYLGLMTKLKRPPPHAVFFLLHHFHHKSLNIRYSFDRNIIYSNLLHFYQVILTLTTSVAVDYRSCCVGPTLNPA